MIKPKLKICGITRKSQGISIAELGVDAIGFILYQKSPRYLEPQRIRQIIQALPPFTKTVGVFVNESVAHVTALFRATGLDLVQLSGDESREYCESLTENAVPWIKGLRVKDAASISSFNADQNPYVLLDAWSDKEYGGTGRVFDWSLIKKRVGNSRVILAGGINPENIGHAIRQVGPYAVDVSSGVETSPGIKSMAKVKALIQALTDN